MGDYVDIAGLKTWYDTAGAGEPLVLLHGGMCTNDTWGAQMPAFAERFHVFAPERRGHGHTPDVEGPLNYSDMATDTIGFLERVVKEPANLVGWSDGGIIGLLVAGQRPDLVRKLVAIGANLNPQGVIPEAHAMFAADPDGPDWEMLRGLYAASSPDGPEHWRTILAKYSEMAATQPDIKPGDLARIKSPTLLISGDDDIATLEHTAEIYYGISGAELAVLPGTSHAVVFEKPELLNGIVIDFLANDPAPTMLPFRRAAVS